MAKKKEQEEMVRCMTCEKAALVQWDNNPVIAHCHKSSYPNVANTPRFCLYYKKNPRGSKITKLTHYR